MTSRPGSPPSTGGARVARVGGLAVRTATAADAPAVAVFVNAAYRGDSSRIGWTTEADLLGGQRVDADGLAALVAAPGSAILVHEDRDGLAACVHLERAGAGCYVGMLTVRPALQRTGVGRALLEAAERWAVERWGSRSAHLTVIVQRTELIAWYERRGYRRTGARKPFPYGDERFGVPLRADLAFEVLEKPLGPSDPSARTGVES